MCDKRCIKLAENIYKKLFYKVKVQQVPIILYLNEHLDVKLEKVLHLHLEPKPNVSVQRGDKQN